MPFTGAKLTLTLLILTHIVKICQTRRMIWVGREPRDADRIMDQDATNKKLANDHAHTTKANAPRKGVRRLSVAELLSGDREVILEHSGQDYRLRITANGKLILTK